MAITTQILGMATTDNAALLRIDTGQAIHRLLFDCGEGVLSGLEYGEILSIDHLFFSHLHMDHVAGFDAFFRGLYGRNTKPNQIWGPERTAEIIQHRFQGIYWNLHLGANATWRVHDILPEQMQGSRFELSEAFAHAHLEPAQNHNGVVLEHEDYTVQAVPMNHQITSLAYIVRERDKTNLEPAKMQALGLKPGAWVRELKDSSRSSETLLIDGVEHHLLELRQQLLTTTTGDAVAYLTDFLLDEAAYAVLEPALRGVRVLVCESQYLHQDLELAKRNFHMTARQVGELAARAGVQELVLFHVSDRYTDLERAALLAEAQAEFANTRFGFLESRA